jgi:hypothetical protein
MLGSVVTLLVLAAAAGLWMHVQPKAKADSNRTNGIPNRGSPTARQPAAAVQPGVPRLGAPVRDKSGFGRRTV